MFDTYRCLRQAFTDDFHVCLSPARADGSRLLVLYAPKTRPIRRRISTRDLADPVALRRLIRSIRFGIAIDQGQALLWLAGQGWQVRVDAAGRNACSARDPARPRVGRRP